MTSWGCYKLFLTSLLLTLARFLSMSSTLSLRSPISLGAPDIFSYKKKTIDLLGLLNQKMGDKNYNSKYEKQKFSKKDTNNKKYTKREYKKLQIYKMQYEYKLVRYKNLVNCRIEYICTFCALQRFPADRKQPKQKRIRAIEQNPYKIAEQCVEELSTKVENQVAGNIWFDCQRGCMDGGGDINSYLLIHPFIFRKGRVAGLQVGGYFKF